MNKFIGYAFDATFNSDGDRLGNKDNKICLEFSDGNTTYEFHMPTDDFISIMKVCNNFAIRLKKMGAIK